MATYDWPPSTGGGGGGSGTVTNVSVTTANGISGSVANPTTTPAISLTIAPGTITETLSSLATKPAVTVVATTNQALTGTPTIDGQATAAGSLILLTAQSTPSQNGPWVAAAGAWSRPTWYPTGGTTQAFQFITTLVRLGSTYQGTTWRMTTAGAITIDTTATTWVVTPLAVNVNTVNVADGTIMERMTSLATKPAVTVVATTNQALTGTPTIDGQATAAGSLILNTAQTAPAENGPWVAAAGAWARPTWYPSGGTTQAFQFITTLVRLGTTYQGTTWRMTTSGAITIDTTGTTWVVTTLAANASTLATAIPVNIGGTGATTAAAARTNLGLDVRHGTVYIQSATNTTIVLVSSSRYAFTINSLNNLKTSSGTITAAIQINGTNVTSLSSLAVTSTPASPSASGANTVAIGDRITLVLSSNAAAFDLEFTMKGTI